MNRNISYLSLQQKIDQFLQTLTNQSKKKNLINRTSLIKNSLRSIRNQLNNDDLTVLMMIQKLNIAFFKLYNDMKRITSIKQQFIFNGEQNIDIVLNIAHNSAYIESILNFDLDNKIIKIHYVENNTNIKRMFYFILLYINYVLFIFCNMNIEEMLTYELQLTATPEARNITNKEISTNNKRLYEYYEYFGFIPMNQNIQRNRFGPQTGIYKQIDYNMNYSNFISRTYFLLVEFIQNKGSSSASS